ncbi:MAG: hypothetical protein ACP5IB_08975 [Thermoplasmata archaeon]
MKGNEKSENSYRNRKSFGERYEYIAISQLLMKGYDVYKTLVDDQGIDCIIRKLNDSRPCYVDLQIKARSKDSDNPALFANIKINKPRENYVFLFFSEKLNKFWIIPSEDLVKIASQNTSGKNKGNYNIDLNSKENSKIINQYEGDNGFKKLDKVFENICNELS